MLGLRGRRFKRRNFELVHQRQVKAYDAYLEEIEELKIEHANAARTVRGLEDKMSRQLMLNSEEKDLLAKRREERDRADVRLKEIESDLKSDAINFEKRIFKWNLLIPPACVLLILLLRAFKSYIQRKQKV